MDCQLIDVEHQWVTGR